MFWLVVKGHTLDIAPPSEGTSVQKRSGMARVVEKCHGFACTLTRLYTNGMNHICLCFPSRSWLSFTGPGGWKAALAQAPTMTVNKLSAQDRYVTGIIVVSCMNRHASLSN